MTVKLQMYEFTEAGIIACLKDAIKPYQVKSLVLRFGVKFPVMRLKLEEMVEAGLLESSRMSGCMRYRLPREKQSVVVTLPTPFWMRPELSPSYVAGLKAFRAACEGTRT